MLETQGLGATEFYSSQDNVLGVQKFPFNGLPRWQVAPLYQVQCSLTDDAGNRFPLSAAI